MFFFKVGIKFDEPVGTNDGTVKGVRIFDCEDGFGSFVRGKNVTVGDFPERDIMDEDSSDDEAQAETPSITANAAGAPDIAAPATPVEEEDEI